MVEPVGMNGRFMSKAQEKNKKSEVKKIHLDDGIGSRIRASREARGYTQAHLAEQTKTIDPNGQGVSRTVIVGYEAEHSKPGAREIKLLCKALFITPNWLLYGEEDILELRDRESPDAIKWLLDPVTFSLHIGLALAALKHHERKLFGELILTVAGRELGHEKIKELGENAKGMAAAYSLEQFRILAEIFRDPDDGEKEE